MKYTCSFCEKEFEKALRYACIFCIGGKYTICHTCDKIYPYMKDGKYFQDSVHCELIEHYSIDLV